jgi:excisionase family DNA binding protein
MLNTKKGEDRLVLQANRSNAFQVEQQGISPVPPDNRTIPDPAEKLDTPARRDRENLLTRKRSAEFLDVSLRTLDRLVAERELVAVKIGRSVRIDPRELDRYVDSRIHAAREGVSQ